MIPASGPVRVGIVGAGAIGGWIGAELALAGNRVSLLARGATLAAIAERGLRLGDGDGERAARVAAADSAGQLGIQDILVLAVKAPSLAAAAAAARAMIGPATLVVPMVNGVPWWFLDGQVLTTVDPDGRIAAALPADRLIGCVVHASASRRDAGAVDLAHCDRLVLGEPGGGTSDRVERLAGVFESSGIRVERSADIRSAIWYKLWGNATLNPLSALTRARSDILLCDPAIRDFLREAMAELAAIGAAIGCPIRESGEDRLAVTAKLGAFKTSMLQDLEAGRPLELEALLGAPIEIARRHGLATARLDLLYSQARLLSESLGLR